MAMSFAKQVRQILLIYICVMSGAQIMPVISIPHSDMNSLQ